jgi:ABC-type phosphate transport system substrate-binding protein
VKEYIDFVLSPRVQETVVRDAGYIPITAKAVHGD